MKLLPSYQNHLVFYVNGKKVDDVNVDPRTTLASYLRQQLKLTGTKVGCNEGGCGTCTVMISELLGNGTLKHYSVNACLTLVCSVHGKSVTTVEGVGSVRSKLHPVQEVFSKGHGSQCGYCTPGFIMAMYSLLRNNPQPEKCEIDEALQGNLCRCTGYRPILESFYTFAKAESGCENGFTNGISSSNGVHATNGNCCGNNVGGCCKDAKVNGVDGCCNGSTSQDCCKSDKVNGSKLNADEKFGLLERSSWRFYDATQDPVFPPELKMVPYSQDYLKIEHESCKWFRPVTLEQLLELKQTFPDAKLVVGNTEIGVEMKFKNCNYPILINPSAVPELKTMETDNNGVVIGAAVCLTDMEKYLKTVISKLPESKTKVYRAIVKMLHWFAGKHIRNSASAAGNLMTASPISDLNPLFMASGSTAVLESLAHGRREVVIDDKFFPSYRKTNVKPDEILISIKIPYSVDNEHFAGFKQAQRREDDIAIVNAGMRVAFVPCTNTIEGVRLSFGGMAPTTVMATRVTKQLVGRQWNNDLLEDVTGGMLLENLPLPPGVPGGMEKYRQSLCLSFFYKFYLIVTEELHKQGIIPSTISKQVTSCIEDNEYVPVSATQIFPDVPQNQSKHDAVGRPEMHLSGDKHTTGEAIYCDDIRIADAVFASFVISRKGHAKIVKVDASPALIVPGVIDYVDYRDVPKNGTNKFGFGDDEEIFVEKETTAFGQIIGAIIAESEDTARRACELVKVEYEDLPTITTIEQAIEANSYLSDETFDVKRGEFSDKLAENEAVFESEVRLGGQEHFYLETQACIVIPKEGDEIEVISATQDVSDIQIQLSKTMGIPAHKIVIKVKRIGGGFGGKQTAALLIVLPCTVAALKLRRPIRCSLERYDDMAITGTRHPYLGKYKMRYTNSGELKSYEVQLYGNGGYSKDLSYAVCEKATCNSDNAYNIPNFHVTGKVCKTNISTSTAFRGFGCPQAMFVMEHCITDVAYSLNMMPEKLREKNFYVEGDKTFYNEKLEKCNLQRCWNECIEISDFYERRHLVDEFNKNNRWKKRGIALIPTKFGVAFEASFMNQSGALVHVYRDGSILLNHGGMEMGQGLHTKMAQIATRVLGVPLDKIYINDTSSDKVPNTMATAASMGSDLNGAAVKNACETIMQRLKPVIEKFPSKTWSEIVDYAYFHKINLSSNGFYKLDRPTNPDTGAEFPFNYFTYGAGFSEVEIDCLTGDHRIIRSDVVMDVGDSLNPAVDIGQIEGAFIQGYGLYTMEELKYSPTGVNYTRGPGTYKIPSADDVPRQFNIKLLKGSSNPRAIFSSKAVGEPPLFLGSSVFFAIKDAIKSARENVGLRGPFRLDSPATPERIRLACQDNFTAKVPDPIPGTYQPWTLPV